MKTLPKYCRECGNKLLTWSERASNIKILMYDSGGGTTYRVDSPFNEKTGEENIAKVATCPKLKKYFLLGANSHDKVVLYKNELHWL